MKPLINVTNQKNCLDTPNVIKFHVMPDIVMDIYNIKT